MSSVPLQTLRTFVEVGQRGSIKAAAQALHVTPGAISQQIRLLEDRVGLALFTRERQGLRLTPAGATLDGRLEQVRDRVGVVAQQRQFVGARMLASSTHRLGVGRARTGRQSELRCAAGSNEARCAVAPTLPSKLRCKR